MNADCRQRYDLAIESAAKAGAVALRYFDASTSIEWKADATPVTVADREAEAFLRTSLLSKFPRDSFLGEESGEIKGDSGFRWIIDPVDATRNFIQNVPLWATLVGLEYRGEMIAGIVEAPALGQTWRALKGDGAYRGERRIHVSTVPDLHKATLYYTSIMWFAAAGKEIEFLNLVHKTNVQRGFGDWYGHVLVAQGSGEIIVDHGLKIWDLAAIMPIVEEAGGRMTDWNGERRCDRPDVLVSNGKLHDAVLGVLRRTA